MPADVGDVRPEWQYNVGEAACGREYAAIHLFGGSPNMTAGVAVIFA